MARLREWMGLTEHGDTTTLDRAGWVQVVPPGNYTVSVDSGVKFVDIEGNSGNYSLKMRNGWGGGVLYYKSPPLATPVSTFFYKKHIRFDTLQSAAFTFFRWFKDATQIGSLVLDTSGHIQVYSGGTLLATSTNMLAINTFYRLEVGITIGNAGTYEVKIDGVDWIPSTVGDTQPGSDTTVNMIGLGVDCINSFIDFWFDDEIADDSAFPGAGITGIYSPNGVGAFSQLTPLAGANWQNIDELPPDLADYNSAASAGLEDTVTHGAIPVAAVTIKSALITALVGRTGDSLAHANLVVRSGGVNYDSAAKDVPLTPAMISVLHQVDPNTSAAWTRANLNSAEIGIKVVA